MSLVFNISLIIITLHIIIPSQCSRRPFYNLAHMSNSKDDVLVALETGANGIEFDVQFDSSGSPLYVYHGYICDCLRKCDNHEDFNDFLVFIRDLSTPTSALYNSNFTLAFVDLKTDIITEEESRRDAGKNLFTALMDNLFNNGRPDTKVKLVLSLLTMKDDEIIESFMTAMIKSKQTNIMPYIGWDISDGQPIGIIRFLFQKLKKRYPRLNIWQSDGITNCLSLFTPKDRVRDAIEVRNSDQNYMSKVCLWTIDLKPHVRSVLRMGVDSILTNYPANAYSVLQENEFKDNFRLAIHSDNPWSKFIT